jgi:hypothetical protein
LSVLSPSSITVAGGNGTLGKDELSASARGMSALLLLAFISFRRARSLL